MIVATLYTSYGINSSKNSTTKTRGVLRVVLPYTIIVYHIYLYGIWESLDSYLPGSYYS